MNDGRTPSAERLPTGAWYMSIRTDVVVAEVVADFHDYFWTLGICHGGHGKW